MGTRRRSSYQKEGLRWAQRQDVGTTPLWSLVTASTQEGEGDVLKRGIEKHKGTPTCGDEGTITHPIRG